MYAKKLAVIGSGFAGVCLMTGIVRAAVDSQQTNITLIVYEPGDIGPGIAYDIQAPAAFKLNHELDFMGSANVHLTHTDPKDFYNWIQQNLETLSERYPGDDLTDPKTYVPRNLFGLYIQARYAELKAYAAKHDIVIHEKTQKVTNIYKLGNGFGIETEDGAEQFDAAVLTTGNYFNQIDVTLARTGKYFRPYDYKAYMSDTIADGSVMLVAGSALSAYDAAIYALESGKYRKVIMASRRGMLRKVRGKTVPYTRRYITTAHLETLAGGPEKPFRLAHLLQAVKDELRHAYGKDIAWKDGYSVSDIISIFRHDIAAVSQGQTLIWRSIHSSLTDDERHEIYARLAPEDKQQFVRIYSSLYQLFSAPMPLSNAKKLQAYLDDGRLELVNGIQSITYDETSQQFAITYALSADGTPLPVGTTPESLGITPKTYPVRADICVDAMGLGRSISHLPLYRNLIASGLASDNAVGGICVNIDSRYVTDTTGNSVEGLYAIGHMTCGETVLPHNSLHLSRVGIAIGADIAAYLATSEDEDTAQSATTHPVSASSAQTTR